MRIADFKRGRVSLRRRFEAVRAIELFRDKQLCFCDAITFVRMKVGPYIGFIVLVMVFGSAILGMLIRRKLPESHLSDETKGVVTLSMGVPFEGVVRVSAEPLRHALEVINHLKPNLP
jgi:hypothetical protein